MTREEEVEVEVTESLRRRARDEHEAVSVGKLAVGALSFALLASHLPASEGQLEHWPAACRRRRRAPEYLSCLRPSAEVLLSTLYVDAWFRVGRVIVIVDSNNFALKNGCRALERVMRRGLGVCGGQWCVFMKTTISSPMA